MQMQRLALRSPLRPFVLIYPGPAKTLAFDQIKIDADIQSSSALKAGDALAAFSAASAVA